MKVFFALVALVFLAACESVTVTPPPAWGTIDGGSFVPVDLFFVESAQTNGDYSLVLIAADRTGYCSILQQNTAGYPANLTYTTFTFSNPVGTGSVDPGPGTYAVTDVYGASPSAQVNYGSVVNCVVGPVLAGTSGNVVISSLAQDLSGMAGTLDVTFGTAGTLSGSYSAPLCDLSNSPQGASQCYQ